MANDDWEPDWSREGQDPTFFNESNTLKLNEGKTSRWGTMPALDMLKLKLNEGKAAPRQIRILQTGSHDIRDIVETIIRLPATYQGKCEFVMNALEYPLLAQNVILLLIAFNFPPEEAAPLMIHMWYSALIPAAFLTRLRTTILPLIEEACAEASCKDEQQEYKRTWVKNRASFQLILPRAGWNGLRDYLRVPNRLSGFTALVARQKVTLNPERSNWVQKTLFAQLPYWRVATMKFRRSGILLPFGCSSGGFDTPNPTFFQADRTWPMPDLADPRTSWNLVEVANGTFTADHIAKNDLYGKLYIHIREILLRFCQQLGKRRLRLKLLCVDPVKLPEHPDLSGRRRKFDRIETYMMAEKAALGIDRTLAIFSPLLESRTENPKATLLTLFITDIYAMWKSKFPEDNPKRAVKFLPTAESKHASDAQKIRNHASSSFFRKASRLFEHYKKSTGFDTFPDKYGIKQRKNNTIADHWPLRPGKKASRAIFDILEATGASGCERYVEWERMVGDAEPIERWSEDSE
ncbi:hypothetical protein N7535_001875 [Penicillium sp. DV-2018c]|nr:hypothetical protein N7535_001875 [Penicillium sp. DV-2018c]